MMLSLKIAVRYLMARKSHSAVNVISIISIAGVALATAAIVVVLSVFNGFAELSARHTSQIDPPLKITPAVGHIIAEADSLAAAIKAIDGVREAMPSISERALLICGDRQLPVVFNSADERYRSITAIDSIIREGVFATDTLEPYPSQLSVGVATSARVMPSAEGYAEIYVPRRRGRINPANAAAAFCGAQLMVTGVTQVDQLEYDADRIIIPLTAARRLLDYTTEATAIEVSTVDGADIHSIAADIQRAIGEQYIVADRQRQQQESFRMIAVEKWVTFLMLAFILVIASFNIISTLSLLVIEKRDNMATLLSLGASRNMVKSIFMAEGWLVTVTGGVCGIIVGVALSLAQQYGGLIKLAADPDTLTVDTYPVVVVASDIAIVAGLIFAVAVIASLTARAFAAAAAKQ